MRKIKGGRSRIGWGKLSDHCAPLLPVKEKREGSMIGQKEPHTVI